MRFYVINYNPKFSKFNFTASVKIHKQINSMSYDIQVNKTISHTLYSLYHRCEIVCSVVVHHEMY